MAADADRQPEYLLHLRALPAPVPPAVRLRRLLKHSLRAFDLHCLELVEVKPGDAPRRGGETTGTEKGMKP